MILLPGDSSSPLKVQLRAVLALVGVARLVLVRVLVLRSSKKAVVSRILVSFTFGGCSFPLRRDLFFDRFVEGLFSMETLSRLPDACGWFCKYGPLFLEKGPRAFPGFWKFEFCWTRLFLSDPKFWRLLKNGCSPDDRFLKIKSSTKVYA